MYIPYYIVNAIAHTICVSTLLYMLYIKILNFKANYVDIENVFMYFFLFIFVFNTFQL